MEEKPVDEERERLSPKSSAAIWIALVAMIIVIGIIYFSRGGNRATSPATTPDEKSSSEKTAPSSNAQNTKSFDISGKPFEFSVKEIKVKKGEKVKVNFTSALGTHDWVIDEFNAKTKVLQAGQSDSVEFTADKTGTFEYYCSVPTHRQQGMVGKIIVE